MNSDRPRHIDPRASREASQQSSRGSTDFPSRVGTIVKLPGSRLHSLSVTYVIAREGREASGKIAASFTHRGYLYSPVKGSGSDCDAALTLMDRRTLRLGHATNSPHWRSQRRSCPAEWCRSCG